MSYGPCLNPEFDFCELEFTDRPRRSNEHHLYWPESNYTTPLEKAFRELPMNKVQLCICAHDALHQAVAAPDKPTVAEMAVALTVEISHDGPSQQGMARG